MRPALNLFNRSSSYQSGHDLIACHRAVHQPLTPPFGHRLRPLAAVAARAQKLQGLDGICATAGAGQDTIDIHDAEGEGLGHSSRTDGHSESSSLFTER